MTVKLTQSVVNNARETREVGTQMYDTEVRGLRVVIGTKSASYKLVTDQWANGRKLRSLSVTIGRTNEISLKDARELAIEKKIAIRRGENPNHRPATGMTLGEAWEDFQRIRGRDLAARTIEWYGEKVNGLLKGLKQRLLSEITKSEARELHRKITERIGAASANHAMCVLKLLYNYAAAVEDLPPNPVSRAVRFNKLKPRDWALSHDELRQFWKDAEALPNGIHTDCWMLMLFTGLRSKSARTARWEDLDGTGNLFIPTPKGGTERAYTVPLSRYLLQRLERRKQENTRFNSPFIFPSVTSKGGYVLKVRREERMPYAPHMMRHTYRNLAVEAGIGFETVTLLMNHRPAHVSFHYITRDKLLPTLRDAQEKITHHLLGILGGHDGQ